MNLDRSVEVNILVVALESPRPTITIPMFIFSPLLWISLLMMTSIDALNLVFFANNSIVESKTRVEKREYQEIEVGYQSSIMDE